MATIEFDENVDETTIYQKRHTLALVKPIGDFLSA